MTNLFCYTCKGRDGIHGREVQSWELKKKTHEGHDVENVTAFRKQVKELRKSESRARNFKPEGKKYLADWWEKHKDMYAPDMRAYF